MWIASFGFILLAAVQSASVVEPVNKSWKSYIKGKIDYFSFKSQFELHRPNSSLSDFIREQFLQDYNQLLSHNFKEEQSILQSIKHGSKEANLTKIISRLGRMLNKLGDIEYKDNQIVKKLDEGDINIYAWLSLRVGDFREVLVWECFRKAKEIVYRPVDACPKNQLDTIKILWNNLNLSMKNDKKFISSLGGLRSCGNFFFSQLEREIEQSPSLWEKFLESISARDDVFIFNVELAYSVERNKFLNDAENLLISQDIPDEDFRGELDTLVKTHELIWNAYHIFEPQLFGTYGIAKFFDEVFYPLLVEKKLGADPFQMSLIDNIYRNLWRIRIILLSSAFGEQSYLEQMRIDMRRHFRESASKRVRTSAEKVLKEINEKQLIRKIVVDRKNFPIGEIIIRGSGKPKLPRGKSLKNFDRQKVRASKQTSLRNSEKHRVPRPSAPGISSSQFT
jgi:hypothetical protein